VPEDRSGPGEDQGLLDADTVRALERLSLASLDAVLAGVAGQRVSEVRGSGGEFADYRHYSPGDDLRRLDWQVYLRLRELLVKVGPEEGPIEMDVLMDTSRSMELTSPRARPSKLRHAQQLGAALGAVALLRSDTVRAWALSDGAAQAGARLDAPNMLAGLEQEVAGLTTGRVTDLPASVRSYRSARARADLAVMISDALVPAPSLTQALGELAAGTRATAFVHVVDRTEGVPPRRGPVLLRDRETGRRLELTLSAAVATAYGERFARFRLAVQDICMNLGVRYLLAPTDVPVLDLLSTSAQLAGLVGLS
jgi:uncharacterized protein (DUF58 family)